MPGGMVVPKGGMFLETYVWQDVFIRGDGLVLFRSSLVVLVFLPFVRMSPLVSVRMGSSCAGSGCEPLFFRPDGSACGYGTGRVWATYLHGVFEDDEFRRAMIDRVRTDAGLKPAGRILVRCDLDGALDRLADIVRESVDLKAIYRSMGLA